MSTSMDDPIVWGALPYSYHFNPDNVRWTMASHDIVFKNKHVFHDRDDLHEV